MKQRKILIVDDEVDIRKYFKKWLEDTNLGIIDVEDSGFKTIEKNKTQRYNIILLDMQLYEEIDGLRVLKEVLENNPECYVIIITAFSEIYPDLEAMKLGAKDYLVKPVDEGMLIRAVKKGIEWLEQKEKIKKLEEEKKQAEIEAAVKIEEERRKAIYEVTRGYVLMIKNSIRTINLNIESLLQITKDKKKKTILDETKAQTGIIEEIMRNLVESTKELHPEPININAILDRVITIMRLRDMIGAIEIIKEYDKKLPDINADRIQLEQVFYILLENAIEAIEEKEKKEKGVITITTQDDNDFVKVSLQDNGIGIHEDNLDRIFEPNFTTKPDKEGSGLGLSICRSHIIYHQGKIEVESKKGSGTKFIIRLPKNIRMEEE